MATLYITEFVSQGTDPNGKMQSSAQQPALAEQTITIAAGSAQSSTFNPQTTLVRLHSDVICSVEFGTSPTATAAKARMAANQTEYFTIPQSSNMKVAVITNT